MPVEVGTWRQRERAKRSEMNGRKIRLMSDNPMYPPIILQKSDAPQIQGTCLTIVERKL